MITGELFIDGPGKEKHKQAINEFVDKTQPAMAILMMVGDKDDRVVLFCGDKSRITAINLIEMTKLMTSMAETLQETVKEIVERDEDSDEQIQT